jgi:hypothetical protein
MQKHRVIDWPSRLTSFSQHSNPKGFPLVLMQSMSVLFDSNLNFQVLKLLKIEMSGALRRGVTQFVMNSMANNSIRQFSEK